MPKYYCDYCDSFLTHDSPSVRKTHNGGRSHRTAVRLYYQKWMENQAQLLIDQTTKEFTKVSKTQQQQNHPRQPVFAPPIPMMGGHHVPPMGNMGMMRQPPPMGMPMHGPPMHPHGGMMPPGMRPMGMMPHPGMRPMMGGRPPMGVFQGRM